MDGADLKEMDIKKSEEYGKINKKLLGNKDEKIDILDYYHGINLNPPYSASNSVSTYAIKPYQLFPFFKTVIVDILPLPNEELFNEYYGMSVEDLIELEQKGKVVIRSPDLYEGYKNVEDDYLDPILSKSPPSSYLINTSYGNLINNKIAEEMEDAHNLFKKEFDFGNNLAMEMGMIDPLTIASFDIVNGSQPNLVDVDDQSYKTLTHNNFHKLSYSGYGNVNTFLKDLLAVGNGRMDYAFTYSTAYASFLADPILSSLNGTHMTNYNMKEILNDLILRTSNKELQKLLLRKSSEILCYDIGKIFTEEISTPLLFNFEESIDYDHEGAINALKSLEDVLNAKNKNDVIDITNELKKEIYEAGQIAKDMRGSPEKNAKRIEKISTTIGFVGELEILIDDPYFKPLLEALKLFGKGGEMVSQTQTLQKAIERVIKLNKPDHVLYLYNNYENVSIRPKTDKIRIMKSRREFRDNLNQKYGYYEHIYKKIPIVRVLIDIDSRLTVGEGLSLDYRGENEVEGEEILNLLNKWEMEYFPVEMFRLFIKHLLLYGRAYLFKNVIKKEGKTHIEPIIINPKFIRAVKKDKKLSYEIIDQNGRKRIISNEYIAAFIPPKNVSMIEKYIPVLDIIYPEITNKNSRPELLYDTIYSNLNKGSKFKGDIYNKSMEMFANTLKIAKSLENLVVEVTVLMAMGDLNKEFHYPKKALNFYEIAQNELDGNAYSTDMKQLENDLVGKIMETQELL